MALIPTEDRVAIKRAPVPETKQGGVIIMPEKAKEKPQEGTIAAVGPNVTNLKVGDVVLFAKYAGMEIEDLIIMKAGDVLAVRS
jgi:chaperonin GroES